MVISASARVDAVKELLIYYNNEYVPSLQFLSHS